MVITFADSRSTNGPRPINPNRDFPQLARLLRQVFADELEGHSQQLFEGTIAAGRSGLLWRLDPFLARLVPGFVWVEEGRIVGNVTLIKTRSPRRYLVANVAIQPEFRRRGIARALMELVQEYALEHGASEIRLQVARENIAAKALYRSLGYVELGTTTSWRLLPSRTYIAPELHATSGETTRELPDAWWREAYELDLAAVGGDLNWPDPLSRDTYRRGWLHRLRDTLSGRHVEHWAISGDSGRLEGLASITGEWGRPHQLAIRVHPARRGELEALLLQKVTRRLQLLPRRRVYLVHDADDTIMNALLPSARFQPERTLTHMVNVFAG